MKKFAPKPAPRGARSASARPAGARVSAARPAGVRPARTTRDAPPRKPYSRDDERAPRKSYARDDAAPPRAPRKLYARDDAAPPRTARKPFARDDAAPPRAPRKPFSRDDGPPARAPRTTRSRDESSGDPYKRAARPPRSFAPRDAGGAPPAERAERSDRFSRGSGSGFTVTLDPDVARVFRGDASVNKALRLVMQLVQVVEGPPRTDRAAPRRSPGYQGSPEARGFERKPRFIEDEDEDGDESAAKPSAGDAEDIEGEE
jgi:hypothetical protein